MYEEPGNRAEVQRIVREVCPFSAMAHTTLVSALVSPRNLWRDRRGHGFWQAGGLWLVGFGCLVALFQDCCSGVAFVRSDAYTGRAEPVRYWVNVFFLAAAYLLLCATGFFW